jgi:hypothetical protein
MIGAFGGPITWSRSLTGIVRFIVVTQGAAQVCGRVDLVCFLLLQLSELTLSHYFEPVILDRTKVEASVVLKSAFADSTLCITEVKLHDSFLCQASLKVELEDQLGTIAAETNAIA